MTYEEIARAFSGHRFDVALDSIAPEAVWDLVGEDRVEGREAIAEVCRRSTEATSDVETTWVRFVSVAAGDLVAVDAVGRYTGPDDVSTVSSCDIYEFEDGLIVKITSYAVELPSLGAPADSDGSGSSSR